MAHIQSNDDFLLRELTNNVFDVHTIPLLASFDLNHSNEVLFDF